MSCFKNAFSVVHLPILTHQCCMSLVVFQSHFQGWQLEERENCEKRLGLQ